MSHYRFRIVLTGDAELRTGIGGESVNSYVPRDADGRPFIPGSHIKGLIRASLKEIAEVRTEWKDFFSETENHQQWPYPLLDLVFGAHDVKASSYFAKVRVEKATLVDEASARDMPTTQFVSRTQLDDRRLAKETSLRTTEAIFAGSEFVGDLFSSFSESSIEGIAWRLGLLAIPAVGGSRSRNGQCVVSLLDVKGVEQAESLESLLRKLDHAICNRANASETVTEIKSTPSAASALSTSTSLIELIYVAATPVCFPERPEQQNLITSGFSIPASAVQDQSSI